MAKQLAYAVTAWLARMVGRLPKPVLARVVAHMAETGEGTDACLAWGCLPMPVHFYSPVPDIKDLRARAIWTRRSSLPGVAFRVEEQLRRLEDLGRRFGAECDWPATSRGDDGFHTENAAFSFGCAAGTHCMIRAANPARVIEVGSGWSTRIIAAALDRNAEETGVRAVHTVIDPYPADATLKRPRLEILRERVECCEPSVFDSLGANDILFIDSGHTVRIGGDVNYLYLDVVPRLAEGVIVHAHDIPMPFDYPEVYATNPRFRMFWTESYLLQAFLACNREFEVRLAMNYLQRDQSAVFRAAFPRFDPAVHRAMAAGFWMQRVAAGTARNPELETGTPCA